MRDQDADCVAKPRRTSRCCNSMGSRAFCDTRTGGMLIGYARVSTQETREESPEKRRRTPLTTFWAAETQLGTHSLCQEPSETGALSPSTLVRNAPLSVQNRTNLPDTLFCFHYEKSGLGVPASLMHSLVKLASAALGQDFLQTARTVDKLGIEGMSREKLLSYVTNGQK